MKENWLEQIKWSQDGLLPAIAQDYKSGRVLMMAWMNRDALEKTVELQRAVYWSRSRQKIWYKGEESGHIQVLHNLQIDCDKDVILMQVEQIGSIACHTGRESCFYSRYENGQWVEVEPVLKDPIKIYK